MPPTDPTPATDEQVKEIEWYLCAGGAMSPAQAGALMRRIKSDALKLQEAEKEREKFREIIRQADILTDEEVDEVVGYGSYDLNHTGDEQYTPAEKLPNIHDLEKKLQSSESARQAAERERDDATRHGNALYTTIVERLDKYFPKGDRGLEWDVLPSTLEGLAIDKQLAEADGAAMLEAARELLNNAPAITSGNIYKLMDVADQPHPGSAIRQKLAALEKVKATLNQVKEHLELTSEDEGLSSSQQETLDYTNSLLRLSATEGEGK